MERKVSFDFKKISIYLLLLTIFLNSLIPFSLRAEELDIFAKKNDFDNLPQRPALAVKKVPKMNKSDFLLLDSDETSRREFFDQVAFIGDSLTQGLTMLPALANVPFMAELGLSLAKATEALSTWQPGNIDVVYILLGINDMTYYFMDAPTYAEHYARLLDALDLYFPEVAVVVQGIFPVSNLYSHQSINNSKIKEFNAALEALAQERDIIYLNSGSLFALEDGSLDPNLTFDGLHIYYQCYGAWLGNLQYVYEYS